MTRMILSMHMISFRYCDVLRDTHRGFRAACIYPSAFFFALFLSLSLSPHQAFYSPRPDFPVRRATILTRTATREIKRDKGRQTW